MKRFYVIFLFVCMTNTMYAQNYLSQLFNEVRTSTKLYEYNGGKSDITAETPDHFSNITVKDNKLIITYSFKIDDGGKHINSTYVPNIIIRNYTVFIDMTISRIHRAENMHSLSISSADGIKIIKSIEGPSYQMETYYIDNWNINVNSEALESKIYNALNDIWSKNKVATHSSTSSVKGNPTSSSKPIQQYNQNTKLFENNYFSFRYPASWDLVSENGQKIDNNTPSVVIMEHRKNNYEFCPSVNVILGYRKVNETPYSIAYNSYKVLKDMFPSAQLIGNVEKAELAGHQAAKVTVEVIMNGVHFRNTQYVIQIRNNIMLALTIGLKVENYIEQQKVANEIVKTLKIK